MPYCTDIFALRSICGRSALNSREVVWRSFSQYSRSIGRSDAGIEADGAMGRSCILGACSLPP